MIRYTEQGGQPYYAQYTLENDILTIDIDGIVETFDFSEMPDGIAESVTPELLPANPILEVSRVDGELDILVIYWYTEEEIKDYETPIPLDADLPFPFTPTVDEEGMPL